MARFQIRMRAPSTKAINQGSGRRPPLPAPHGSTLMARIEDLELRLTLLEARLRAVSSERLPLKRSKAPRKERPRCPGCVLEIPAGRRKDSCGWCGFRFEAVGGLARRQVAR